MRKTVLTAAALAALCVFPSLASAQEPGATAGGALTGAAVGAVVGGPIGAVVGAGIGGTVGAAATSQPGPVVEERTYVAPAPAPMTRERSCVREPNGTVICEEFRR